MVLSSDETSSSAAVLNHFHIMNQSISSIKQLFFSFPLYFFIYELNFIYQQNLSFELFEACEVLNLISCVCHFS